MLHLTGVSHVGTGMGTPGPRSSAALVQKLGTSPGSLVDQCFGSRILPIHSLEAEDKESTGFGELEEVGS